MLVRARTEVNEDLLVNAISGKLCKKPKDTGSLSFLDSGSSALYLFLDLLGKGKRVGVQVFTCSTVIDAILAAGDKPVFFDINPDYYTTTLDILEKSMSEIDILLLSHLFGIPNPDYISIKKLCERNNVVLIDDLCQTYRAKVNGQYLEDLSDNFIYSFFYDKPVSSLSGGMIKVANEYKDAFLLKCSKLRQENNSVGRRRLKTLCLMHKLLSPELYTEEFRNGEFWKCLLGLWPQRWSIHVLNRIVHCRRWMSLMDRFLCLVRKKEKPFRMSEIEMSYIISMMSLYHHNNERLVNFLNAKDINIPKYLKDNRITCSCAKRAIIKKKIRSIHAQVELYNWPSLVCSSNEYACFPNAVNVINTNVNVPCWTDIINEIDIEFD